jgi:GT2 family glycosyltransferase
VVVCTRDRAERLNECLPTLLAQTYPCFEVLVVDNAPTTAKTADLLAKRYGGVARLRYVREDRPGLPWARNRGLLDARGEIVAYTDDDALADRYWLAALVSGFWAADNVACVTGLVMPAEIETPSQAWFEQFGGFSRARGFERLMFDLHTNRPREPLFPYLASRFGAGVNMAFSASALRAIGGFDPAFLTGQDIEAFYRTIRKGYTLVYEPSAIVRHYHRRDYAGLRRQVGNYGSAFTAFLAKCVLEDPVVIARFIGALPHAARYLADPRSARNVRRRGDYPGDLANAELIGMLCGPLAYLQRRRRALRIAREFGPLDVRSRTATLLRGTRSCRSVPE